MTKIPPKIVKSIYFVIFTIYGNGIDPILNSLYEECNTILLSNWKWISQGFTKHQIETVRTAAYLRHSLLRSYGSSENTSDKIKNTFFVCPTNETRINIKNSFNFKFSDQCSMHSEFRTQKESKSWTDQISK